MSIAHKRAALELSNLSTEDREWVIGRLAPAEQATVKPLLTELDAMNIRFDIETEAGRNLDEADDRTASNAASVPPATARSALRDASAADVVRVLSDEPAWLASAVLAIDEWPWARQVREMLAQKGSLRGASALRQSAPLPPSLTEALLSLVSERLRGAEALGVDGHRNGHAGALNGFSVWHRVWPKVRQWLS